MGYSWQFAFTAVFIEGLLFILLTVTGLRTMMVEAMPFTCSIADGILLGIISWVALHLLTGHAKQLSLGTVILALLFVMKYLFL